MIAPRRLLPSMPGLMALEAVDRLGTASAAAAELSLTQGAVSRALQALEGQLQTPLLVRDRQRLRLTPAAQDYVTQVRAALTTLGQAATRLRSNPGGDTLSLAILPAFGVEWLAPRLPLFTGQNPGITLTLSTRLRPFDFAAEGFDAAIHFGRPDWSGAEHLLLLEEDVLPVCAPGLLPQPLSSAAELLNLPLLQLESRPGAWGRYLAAAGVPGAQPKGMLFDQFATMSQAAVHGLGVALLPMFLIGGEVASGRLVPAWNMRGSGLGSYYFVWPRDAAPRAPLLAFRNWVAGQISVLSEMPP
jgi:LysR family glycine cleavage system transcriptional activator